MKRFSVWCFTLSLFFGLATSAWAVPKQLELTYEIKRNGKAIANVVESFYQDGKTYRIQSVTKGSGVYALMGERQLMSNGTVSKEGLKPLHFESYQTSNPSKALINDFDWPNQLLNMQVKGEAKQEPLVKGTQDLLSVMYQWMFVNPKSGRVVVPVTIGKRLKSEQYQVDTKKPLQTKAGNFKAVKLTNAEGDKQVYLAADKQYIPIKIVLNEDGATLEQTVVKVKFE